ncbi:hypothetical protein FISHEDRAFT_47435, partial [Fistulina hepatica ATCC 64428]
ADYPARSATYFYQYGNAGACGTVHEDTDLIAAIDADRYGDTGDHSWVCGKRVKITNTENWKAHACPTCDNSNSIDLSTGAFQKIAELEEGIVPSKCPFLVPLSTKVLTFGSVQWSFE